MRFRWLVVWLFLFALLPGVVACAQSARPTPLPATPRPTSEVAVSTSPEPRNVVEAASPGGKIGALRTISVGLIPTLDSLAFYVAMDKGYLEEQGLKAEVSTLATSPEVLRAVADGELDVGITNAFSHLLAVSRGEEIQAVTGGSVETRASPQHALLVRGDSGITRATELEWRRIGINALRTADHLMVQEWLRLGGADPGTVQFVELPFVQHGDALADGRIDASAPPEPYASIEQLRGAAAIGHPFTVASERTLVAYFVAANAWLEQAPDLARRFASAVHKGSTFAMKNQAEARQIAAKHLRLEPAVAEQMRLPDLATQGEPALLQWWIDLGVRRGLLSATLDPTHLLFETVR